ncbi:hypothetical protein SBA3_3080002 [Candidatus Sulfopaludibacter sp. SbA3]|nr:hypothetical protein SBA3_3080002 [Candidatus Sulfopaludibacter sp. SbA3]
MMKYNQGSSLAPMRQSLLHARISAHMLPIMLAMPVMCFSQKWWDTARVAADCQSSLPSITQRIHPDVCVWSNAAALPAGTHETTATDAEYEESWGLDVSSMPQCIARDLAGNMLTYWWGSQTNTASIMDPHCPPWLDVVETHVRQLIGREGISQDNLCVPNFMKGGGFAQWDRSGFIDYLKARVASGALSGLPSAPDNIDIAQYISSKGYTNGNPAALDDLIFHEFVRYQYRSNLDLWAGIVQRTGASAAASGNEDLLISGNQGGIWTPGGSWVYSALLSQYHKAIEIEDFLETVPLPQYHHSLIYKLGLASGYQEKPVWIRGDGGFFNGAAGQLYLSNSWRLAIAEAYANGGVRVISELVGTQAQDFSLPGQTINSAIDYVSWLNRSRDWMTGKLSRAAVALVYSIPTMLWREFPTTGHGNWAQISSLSGFARALEDSHIPFDSVFFGHPDFWDDSRLAAALKQYKVVVLPGIDCLGDSQIQVLKDYLAGGGSIVATGSFGSRDENYAVRRQPASASFTGNSRFVLLNGSPDANYFDAVQKGGADSTDLNVLSQPVQQFLGSEAQITTNAPPTVTFNITGSPDGTDLYVHLLNYDLDVKTDTVRSANNLQVSVKLPAGFDPQNKSLWIASPELPLPAQASFTVSGGALQFQVSSVASHVIAAFCDRHAQLAATLGQDRAQPVLLYKDAASLLTTFDSASQALDAGSFNDAAGFLDSFRSAAAAAGTIRLYVDESHDEAVTVDPQRALALNPQDPQYVLLEVLTSNGAIADRQTTGPITYANLTSYDALVIAEPRQPLSGDETEAVLRFVRAGGGLILIGNGLVDSANINSIAAAFGLRYLSGPLCSNPGLWDAGSFYVAYIDPTHPVTVGLSTLSYNNGTGSWGTVTYNWGTGLLTDAPWLALVKTGPEAWLDSNRNQVRDPAERSGPFIHTGVRNFGSGRVIAVGDNLPFRAGPGDANATLGMNAVNWAGAGLGPRRSVIQSAGADIEAAAADGRSVGLSNARADLAVASAAALNNDYPSARASALKASDEAQSAVSGTTTPPSLCCLQNAADYGPDGGGGTWMSLLGQRLSATTRSWGAADFVDGKPPTALDGVSVAVNGVASSVAYISPGQVNFLVPDGVAGVAQIGVTAPAGTSQLTVDTVAASPALFCYSASNNRWVAAIHSDGVLVSGSGLVSGTSYRPAAPGESISLYGTGFGLAASWASGASVASPVVVRVGGSQADITFAGPVSPGVYQVNLTVPDLPDGDHAVELEVSGQAAISDALLPVKR